MIRTTLMLPEDLKRRAAGLARERGVSLAKLVRAALVRELDDAAARRPQADPLFAGYRSFEGDAPTDLAARHDHYLYGDES